MRLLSSLLILILSSPLWCEGVSVRNIQINNLDVFDSSHQEFCSWPFQFLNRLHVRTRKSFIRSEMLIKEGDLLDPDLLMETERNLRRHSFLSDVSIQKEIVNDKQVDLIVNTEDQWTTNPKLSFGRSGGRRVYDFGITETNFLGWGKEVGIQYGRDYEREGISGRIHDSRFLGSRLQFDARLGDFSDGHANSISFTRPFFSQDSRWSYQVYADNQKRDEHLYYEGIDAAAIESVFHSAGFSMSRAWGKRYRRDFFGIGFGYGESIFPSVKIIDAEASEQDEIQRNLDPENLQTYNINTSFHTDRQNFAEFHYLDRFGRTEDLPYGFRAGAAVSYAHNMEGNNFITVNWSGRWAVQRHSSKYFVAQGNATIRRESTDWNNFLADVSLRYFQQKKRMNLGILRIPRYTFAANVSALLTGELDIPYQVSLGEEDGLRGYDFKQFTGKHRILMNLEHRFNTPWENRFVGFGIVAFTDAGNVWGSGSHSTGASAGVGLRIAFKKYGRTKLIRIDYAYPLINANGRSGSVSISSGHLFNAL